MRRIDEVSFADLTPLGKILQKHLGADRYVHFSTQKNRFGVNPQQVHSDPPGVYFYPIDWLWNHEDFHGHQQWATNFPYFFIAEINFSSPGLDVAAITEPEIEALGEKNGWLEGFSQYNHWTQAVRGPGQKMWEYLKHLNGRTRAGRVSWLKTLRGMHWIKDTKGIILAQEPNQVCVIDPRCIRLVETGEQKRLQQHDWEKTDYWEHAIKTLFTTIADKNGGTVVWKHKKPRLKIGGKDWNFSVEWNDSFSSAGLRLEWRVGRAIDSASISARVMRDSSMDEITAKIEEYLEVCKQFDGNDLLFNPVIPTDEALLLLRRFVANPPKPEFEIVNSSKFLRIDTTRLSGRPPVTAKFGLMVDEEKVNVSWDVQINGTRLMTGNGVSIDRFEEQFWKNLDIYSKQIANVHPDLNHYKAFEKDEWEPFLGWMFTRTGFKVLEQYEEKFHNCRNLRDLYRQIDFIFSRVGW